MLNKKIDAHPVWSYAQAVEQACGDFFKNLRLNYFDYARFYDDGRMLFLFSDCKWVNYFFTHPNYVSPASYLTPGVHLWRDYVGHDFIKIANSSFQHGHGVTFVTENIDFVEVMNFAASVENTMAPYLYINKQNLLIEIGQHITHTLQDLIKKAESEPLILTAYNRPQSSILEWPVDSNINFSIAESIQKNCLITMNSEQASYPFSITKREADCLSHLLKGDSAKVIAKKLIISHRTVEKHLDAIREKAGCRTRLELISYLSTKKISLSALTN